MPNREPRHGPIRVEDSPSGIAVGDDLIWVTMGTIGEVWGFNPETGARERRIPVEDDPYGCGGRCRSRLGGQP